MYQKRLKTLHKLICVSWIIYKIRKTTFTKKRGVATHLSTLNGLPTTRKMVERVGFEPTTSRISDVRSDQLSYLSNGYRRWNRTIDLLGMSQVSYYCSILLKTFSSIIYCIIRACQRVFANLSVIAWFIEYLSCRPV